MFAFFAALFSSHAPDTAVRATLADGQVLMGEVHTPTLLLEGGAGTLEIPLEDVGEVVPVEGAQLGEAEGYVDVWLRNGSELRGRWANPALAMGIAVGGAEVAVDLPMNELARFQLQGGESWPTGAVYRMRTTWGDDFLVDPTRTHLVLENKLGTFEPLLSECRTVAPVANPDGDWRIELATGTILVGRMRDDTVTVALPMGPESVTVPLARFVSLRAEDWSAPPTPANAAAPPSDDGRVFVATGAGVAAGADLSGRSDEVSAARVPTAMPAPEATNMDDHGTTATATTSSGTTSAGWFDRSALSSTKAARP